MMNQRGFTIIEMMISLVVSGFILGGVMFTYLSMKVSTNDTLEIGELQESGRLAMDILRKDIELTGFWGTFDNDTLSNKLVTSPGVVSNDCSEGDNNGSFPIESNQSFRFIYALEAQSNSVLNCINTAVESSDILQIKRVSGKDLTDQTSHSDLYYFISQSTQAQIITPPATGAPIALPHDNATAWAYKHHVYFIENQSYKVGNQSLEVPTLVRKRLSATKGMISETIMEGVENMRFIFGLDTTGDNRVDLYNTQAQMGQSDWNDASILTVQVFLLVRSFKEDMNKNAIEKTYILGGTDTATQRKLTFNDKYRRTLFVSTIKIANAGDDQWRM